MVAKTKFSLDKLVSSASAAWLLRNINHVIWPADVQLTHNARVI
jgi:hypothetical protein